VIILSFRLFLVCAILLALVTPQNKSS